MVVHPWFICVSYDYTDSLFLYAWWAQFYIENDLVQFLLLLYTRQGVLGLKNIKVRCSIIPYILEDTCMNGICQPGFIRLMMYYKLV